jgi:cytoskeletal protein RodZ
MDEKTKLEKTKRWFENQRLIVILAIVFIAFIAIAQVFEGCKNIKESVDSFKSTEEETITEKETYELEISGKVVSSKGSALEGAKAEILESLGTISRTDNNGNFILNITLETPIDRIEVAIKKDGYIPYTQKTTIKELKSVHLGIIELQELPSTPSPAPTQPKITKTVTPAPTENNVNFEGNTFNGNVINNPTGTINIDQTINLTPDTIKNE